MCVSRWLSSLLEAGGRFSGACHIVLLYAAILLSGRGAVHMCLVCACLWPLASFEPAQDIVNVFMIERGVFSIMLKDFSLDFAICFHLAFPSSSMDLDCSHTGLSVRCGS